MQGVQAGGMGIPAQPQQTVSYNTAGGVITTELIQKYLDENKQLILAILDNQNLGKLNECAQYQARLQQNLMYLAAIADAQPQVPPPQMTQTPPQNQGYAQPPPSQMQPQHQQPPPPQQMVPPPQAQQQQLPPQQVQYIQQPPPQQMMPVQQPPVQHVPSQHQQQPLQLQPQQQQQQPPPAQQQSLPPQQQGLPPQQVQSQPISIAQAQPQAPPHTIQGAAAVPPPAEASLQQQHIPQHSESQQVTAPPVQYSEYSQVQAPPVQVEETNAQPMQTGAEYVGAPTSSNQESVDASAAKQEEAG